MIATLNTTLEIDLGSGPEILLSGKKLEFDIISQEPSYPYTVVIQIKGGQRISLSKTCFKEKLDKTKKTF